PERFDQTPDGAPVGIVFGLGCHSILSTLCQQLLPGIQAQFCLSRMKYNSAHLDYNRRRKLYLSRLPRQCRQKTATASYTHLRAHEPNC
ncbi:hypothetical protein KC219_23235, partial [Mycobacterium tuberculosis]|nr:hypothetical protein [Mycobacterium tuberculosis]